MAQPFLAGATQGTDAAYRGGATVAPPFLAGAMPEPRTPPGQPRHGRLRRLPERLPGVA